MLKILDDMHIRFMKVSRLKKLLAEVDDSLLVTCAVTAGNLVIYADESFAYGSMVAIIDFNQEVTSRLDDIERKES